MSIGHPSLAGEPAVPNPEQVGLIRLHLKQVLASHAFAGSKRTQDFLELIVTHALEGEFDQLRERMIGAEMFGRPVSYDTGSDSVVRVKATDVRKKLAQYYAETKEQPAVRIELPSGSYVPRVHFGPPNGTAPSGADAEVQASGQRAAARHERQSGAEHHDSVPHAPAEEESNPLAGHGSRRSPRLLAGIALAIIVLAAAGYLGFRKWLGETHAPSEIRSIAVLPLENLSGDPAQEYFADGMTEELINDLGQVSTLRVISLTSSMSYKGTKKKLPEIARELAVDGVVEGGGVTRGQSSPDQRAIDRRPKRSSYLGPILRAGLYQRSCLAG